MISIIYSIVLSAIFNFSILNFSKASTGSICSTESVITYTVSMHLPSNHLYEVNLKVENFSPNPDDYIDFTLTD